MQFFSQMAFPVKQVRTSEERLCIIEEVEKNASEKRIDVAKQLGLPPSTLNMIIAKKKIREHAYVSVDQELATYGVLCVEQMCGELGSGSCVEEVQGGGVDDDDDDDDDDDEAEPEPVPSFMEELRAFESMRAFMYAHITERDQANIVNIESLFFKLKRKGAIKQMKINDFLKNK
jgi:hypothetical protein